MKKPSDNLCFRWKPDTLIKCENVLKKLHSKVVSIVITKTYMNKSEDFAWVVSIFG